MDEDMKQLLREYLRENLDVIVDEDICYSDRYRDIRVTLTLEGERLGDGDSVRLYDPDPDA